MIPDPVEGWVVPNTDARPPDIPAVLLAEEVEARLARIEMKQDALYTEIHALRADFTKLIEGVSGAMQSNPLLRRLLGGGK